MTDNYKCVRCGSEQKWEQLEQTPQGNLFCPDCWLKLNSERSRRCPADDSEMDKRLVCDIVIIDTCPACGGTWFDEGELEIIRRKWSEAGWSRGFLQWWLLLGASS